MNNVHIMSIVLLHSPSAVSPYASDSSGCCKTKYNIWTT